VDFTEIFPTELIEKILSYVPASNDLFLINKRINGIIGNSEQLMKGYELLLWKRNLNSNEIDVLVKTNRKFSSVRFFKVESAEPTMEKLILLLGRLHIKSLSISFCSLTSEFHQILAAVSKDLDKIDLNFSIVSHFDMEDTLKFKKLTTIELNYNNASPADVLFPFLSARNLKYFEIWNGSLSSSRFTKDEITTVFDFLKAQQNLKTLILDYDLSRALMMKEFADTFDLQLDKFSVESVDSADLLKFLRKQNTLKELVIYGIHIGHDEMQYFLNEMKSLKSLQITRPHFDVIDSLWTLEKNLTIEKIAFGYSSNHPNESIAATISALFNLNLLPNLKIVSFHGFSKILLSDIMPIIRSTAGKLEELQFRECEEIPSLEMKQLCRIKHDDNSDEKSINEFLKINTQVVCSFFK
jgi:hypothetical protein